MILSSAPVSADSFSRPFTHSAMNGSPTGDGMSSAIGLSPVGTLASACAAGSSAGAASSEGAGAASEAGAWLACEGAGAVAQPAKTPAKSARQRSREIDLFIFS